MDTSKTQKNSLVGWGVLSTTAKGGEGGGVKCWGREIKSGGAWEIKIDLPSPRIT